MDRSILFLNNVLSSRNEQQKYSAKNEKVGQIIRPFLKLTLTSFYLPNKCAGCLRTAKAAIFLIFKITWGVIAIIINMKNMRLYLCIYKYKFPVPHERLEGLN